MKIMNLLTSGGVGGIEILCRDIAEKSSVSNCFCFLFGGGIICNQMKNAGAEVYSYDTKKLSGEKLRQLEMVARGCDIIVVHHDDPFLQMYYLALMQAFPKKKYISMIHHCYDPIADNLGYGLAKRTMKKWLVARLMKKSDKLVFVSVAGYESYAKCFKVQSKNVEIVYNGISKNKLEAGAKCVKDKAESIRLSYVGRLVELKGVDKIIEILPKLNEKYEFQLSIVGDGKTRTELEKKVCEFGFQDKVKFYGFQENIDPYLEKTDIFLYPSKTEIFGISIVEAMAFQCICVANNVGGIPEIVHNKQNGFLNMDNTVDGLYQTIDEAISTYFDDGCREKMMKEARQTAEKFSIDKTIVALEDIYKGLLEGLE